VLKEILGHSTMEMVQRYVHLAQVDIEEAHRQASPVYTWDLRV
jgi:site-specific recombinase XerD